MLFSKSYLVTFGINGKLLLQLSNLENGKNLI